MKIKSIIKIILILLSIIICIRNIYKIYLKITKNVAASDLIFLNRNWSSYQYIEFNIISEQNNYFIIKKKIINIIRKWSKKQRWYTIDKINGLVKKSKLDLEEYIQRLNLKISPDIENKCLPFYIVFFDNIRKYIVFLSHYYCDGQIFVDFMNKVTNNNQVINWKPYKYIPIISDIKLLKYLVKGFITIRNYKPELKLDQNKSCILSMNIDISNKKYNRCDIFAIIFNIFFKYVSCNKIKVAFTMGIEDDPKYYNRIGIITRNIVRKKNVVEYKKMIKKNISTGLSEGLSSYDLIRNFPVHLLRSNFDSHIDMVFTSARYNNSNTSIQYSEYDVCSFIGLGKIPVYINTITKKNILTVSLKISTQQFDCQKFLKNEPNSRLHHTFSKNYNIYEEKYYSLLKKYKKLNNSNQDILTVN